MHCPRPGAGHVGYTAAFSRVIVVSMRSLRAGSLGLLLCSSLACGAKDVEPTGAVGPATAEPAERSRVDPLAVAKVRALVTGPRPELVGDPSAAEREIIAIEDALVSDDLLLTLPGSHGRMLGNDERMTIAEGGRSVGAPDSGALEGGVQLPLDPASYTRRNASRSYATTQTLRTIQSAIGVLRNERGVQAEVLIGDLSLPRGGPFAPHVSHTSGRDIDVRLVLAKGLDRTTLPLLPEQVDWDATWALVHSFLETGHVTYVFLDFAQQAHLRSAALRAGVHARVLDRWFQFPDAANTVAIVRHEPGHRAHLHIRLNCEGQGPRCQGA